MKFIKIKFICFFLTLAFLASCNDLPTELGYSLVDDTVSIALITSNDTNLIGTSETFYHKLSHFNTGSTYIGRTGNYKAYTFLRFGGTFSTKININNIQSAELIMYPRKYTFGDTNSNTLSFNIYEINKLWEKTYTSDSLDNDPSFLNNSIIGSYSQKIPLVDSLLSNITIPLDKNLVLKWLDSTSSTALKNYGIALIPDLSSNVIRQFSAQEIGQTNAQAYIKIKYINDSSKVDSITMKSSLEFSCLNKPSFTQGQIQVQAGTGLRTKLNFDFSMLPDLAAIHKSELELTYDPTNSFKGNIIPNDTVSILMFDQSDTLMESPIRAFFGVINKSSNKVICPSITSGIEDNFLRRSNKKGFMVISYYGSLERRRLDKHSFFSNSEKDASKRPYLKVIYSKRLRSTPDVK